MAIEEGTADVIRGDETIATLGPGDFFGEIGVLEKTLRTASVVATHADAADHADALGPQARRRDALDADPRDDRSAPPRRGQGRRGATAG